MKQYTPYLTIFLIVVIVGFSIYKQLMTHDTTEGLTSMDDTGIIKRSDGITVKRRKKKKVRFDPLIENYKEGIANPIKAITKFGKSIGNGIANIGKYIGQLFVSLFSYIECGFYKIINLPRCMGWYMLEVFGYIMYIPWAFFFWVCSLEYYEKQLWKIADQIDCFCYASTGYHVFHYSDSIIKKCYKCKIKPMPKPPKF